MWHVLEYKKTPKSSTWIFHSMSGDKVYMEALKGDLEANGTKCRLREQE